MKKPTIKPCPFCGKDARYHDEEGFISCMDSEGGCDFFFEVNGTLAEALQTWNTRAPETINAMGNNAGKLWKVFSDFMTACANGKTIVFEGNNFIAMDKNSWHNAIKNQLPQRKTCPACLGETGEIKGQRKNATVLTGPGWVRCETCGGKGHI